MSSEQISAATDSVGQSVTLITSLVGGNMSVIFNIVAVIAIMGFMAFLIRSLYGAVNFRQ